MSTPPKSNTELITVDGIRASGLDLIFELSNGTEARHEMPRELLPGEVYDCEGSDWLLVNEQTGREYSFTTEDLIEEIGYGNLEFALGYLGKYHFEYLNPNKPSPFDQIPQRHYVFAVSTQDAWSTFNQHRPEAVGAELTHEQRNLFY